MIDGNYAVEYRTAGFPGAGGQLYLENGRITGSDAGYRWSGTFDFQNGIMTAKVLVQRDIEVPVLNVWRP